MNLGERILSFRKSKGYSQEDIANKLNVSRQTVSKWETNSSMPEADKIVPLCELFGITTDELLIGVRPKDEGKINKIDVNLEYKIRKKHAFSLCVSVFLYFISIMWIIFSDGIKMNENIIVVVFLGICALATVIIIYSSIVNKQRKKVIEEVKKEENLLVKKFNEVMALIFLIVYLLISFMTMAWHITWIIWVIYAFCEKIVELVFDLKEKK